MTDMQDPFVLFQRWMNDADAAELNDPNAMALATCTPDGRPSVRMVLLKGFDSQGFVFYTNLTSRKGQELQANPFAALCFHWKSLRRQVRVEGPMTPVSDAEADAYFQSRPRDSRLGAWASLQSHPMDSRFDLERRIAEMVVRFGVGMVPRPPHWSGFRLVPDRIEFWQDRPFRLHDRHLYERKDHGGWAIQRLYP